MKNTHIAAPIKIALIGVSGYGDCHYKSILQLAQQGLVQLAAATVINQIEEADKCTHLRNLGCRLYSDYITMLKQEAGRIDLCAIPTGIGWHKSMTIAALKAGMHVLVEKPAAATLNEIDAMQQAQRAAGRHVFVGFQNMYADLLWQIKDRLLSGDLGQLRRIKVCALWPRPQSYYQRTNWAGKLYQDGSPIFDSPANNAMAHFILMALFWGGTTRQSVAKVSNLKTVAYRAQAIESFDTISAQATLPNNVELLINMSHSADEFMPAEICVETSCGHYYWNDLEGSLIEDTRSPQNNRKFPAYPETRIVMFQRICEHLQGTGKQTCSLEIARGHTELIEQIHKDINIQNVPEDWIHTTTKDGATFTRIKNLSKAIKEAHNNNCLLWNDAPPWHTEQTSKDLQAS